MDNYCIALLVLVLFFLYIDNENKVEGYGAHDGSDEPYLTVEQQIQHQQTGSIVSQDNGHSDDHSGGHSYDHSDDHSSDHPLKNVPKSQDPKPIGLQPHKVVMKAPPSIAPSLTTIASSENKPHGNYLLLDEPSGVYDAIPSDLPSAYPRVGSSDNLGRDTLYHENDMGDVGMFPGYGAYDGSDEPYLTVEQQIQHQQTGSIVSQDNGHSDDHSGGHSYDHSDDHSSDHPLKNVPKSQDPKPIGLQPHKVVMKAPPSIAPSLTTIASSENKPHGNYLLLDEPSGVYDAIPSDLPSAYPRVGSSDNLGRDTLYHENDMGDVGMFPGYGAYDGSDEPYLTVEQQIQQQQTGSIVSHDKGDSQKTLEIHMIYADWCGHSRNAKGAFEEVKNKFNGKNINGHNVIVKGTEENDPDFKELSEKFNVQGFPTIVAVKNGEVVDDQVGRSKEELTKAIQGYSSD